MAQIKNIKKPGDLIRGASVGLAGLDKDGNVVGYKAAAADAGKVLTVGEDGGVAPAEGGGNKLYSHLIIANSDGPNCSAMCQVYTFDSTPFTRETFIDYIKSKSNSTITYPTYAPDTIPAVPIPISGMTRLAVGFSVGGYGNTKLFVHVMQFDGTDLSFGPNSFEVATENNFSDTVSEV